MSVSLRPLLLALTLALPLAGPVFAQDATPAAVAAPAAATVTDFQDEASLNAAAAKGTTVVFFYANWCPDCRATVGELQQRWNEVRPDLTLVIADYDKETALKQKFGVTYQDTFVLLDDKGNGIKSWNSGGVEGLNKNSSI